MNNVELPTIKLNSEIADEYLDILKKTSEQWFYGCEYTIEDHQKFCKALKYFEDIKVQQRKKLIKNNEL